MSDEIDWPPSRVTATMLGRIERLERVRRDDRAGELRDPVDHGHHRLDAPRDEKAGRHRGIEMAGDAHRRRDEQREDQAVREGDVHARPPAPDSSGLVMIVPPPMNTSANVPMNSAAK